MWLGCALLHLFLIFTVGCRDTFSVLARGFTWLPSSLEDHWRKAEQAAGAATGQSLEDSNLLQLAVTAYLHCAGIEGGYGFFAPNVPNSSKLVFELHYDDGRVEYELPQVNGAAAGLRLNTLLEYVGNTDSDPLRQIILRMLAHSIWQEHPEATTVRTVLGNIREPTPAEAKLGKSESYKFLYAYDFSFQARPAASPSP